LKGNIMVEIDTSHTRAEGRGPVRRSERALAPDLARGSMLLFIALANAANFAFASQPGIDVTPDGLERVFNLLMLTLVDSRAYPVFAVMFGYGLVQLARRQEAAGATPRIVRSVLLRRNAWLVAFGALHATLLYFGDFLGAYGLVGIIATLLLLRRSDRFQRIVLWLWALQAVYMLVIAGMVVGHLVGGSSGSAPVDTHSNDSLNATSYTASIADRLGEWPLHTATVVGFIVIVWLGMWAARARLLDEPAAHRRTLAWVAVVGLGIAVIGGLPHALLGAGMLDVDAAAVGPMALLHAISGEFAGPGYVALFGLLAVSLGRSGASPARTLVVSSLTALGQRSLSGYLFQSVAWVILLSPYTLALGDRLGSTSFTAAGCAILIWLVSLTAAHQMGRRSFRGPAEILLRRLTYGRTAASGRSHQRTDRTVVP
jgi:uncharacterized membrane protein YeiB